MKIRIYQINLERDTDKVAFMALDTLPKLQESESINSALYDRVYEADVDCSNLEDVFKLFNLNHPAAFAGRSLSVSDVVEIVDAPAIEAGFYFCDSIGFKRVDFDPAQAQVKEAAMRVVICEPGKPARVAMIKPGLESLQSVVGGYLVAPDRSRCKRSETRHLSKQLANFCMFATKLLERKPANASRQRGR